MLKKYKKKGDRLTKCRQKRTLTDAEIRRDKLNRLYVHY